MMTSMRRGALLVLLGFLVAACGDGDGGGSGDACRTHGDCPLDEACAGVNDPQVCGIPPREGCTSDADCGGERCHVIADPCSPDGFGSECRPACTGACGDGFRCDAGACVAIRCDEGAGVTCAGREVCDPARITATTPAWDRGDACYAVACSDDSACGDRYCVNGTCQDEPGTCMTPVLVP